MTTTSILESIYEKIITQADIITFELDKNNRVVYINSLCEKHFGDFDWQEAQLSDRSVLRRIVHAEDIKECMTLFEELGENECKSVICRVRCKNRKYRWFRITICRFHDEELGDITRKIGMMQDVNNELMAFRQIKDYEEYDGITGLYNENKFEFEARALMQLVPNRKYCTIAFDINNFNVINEVYGTQKGNIILKYVAAVIRKNVPAEMVVARLYADNFAIFMYYEREEEIIRFIDILRDNIAANPYDLALATTYGIFIVDEKEDLLMQIATMKDRALIAKSSIKKDGIKYYRFFTDELSDEIAMEQGIEADMYKALVERQFEIYLQPKVTLSTGDYIGAEALIRWQHPEKGMIYPERFIPIFEKNGFIINLDKYVCEEVCRVLKKWIESGIKPIPISVNLSRLHIYNENIIDYLVELVEKYNLSPEYLRFEITETVFIGNMDALVDILGQLRKLGFKVEMDDFGSGYSSLNMLRNVPVDMIKIDKEFFGYKMDDNKGKIVISHTIAMAKDLELEVLAEGVETSEHARFLKDSNCDMAQGYFFAKPMPIEAFEKRFLAGE